MLTQWAIRADVFMTLTNKGFGFHNTSQKVINAAFTRKKVGLSLLGEPESKHQVRLFSRKTESCTFCCSSLLFTGEKGISCLLYLILLQVNAPLCLQVSKMMTQQLCVQLERQRRMVGQRTVGWRQDKCEPFSVTHLYSLKAEDTRCDPRLRTQLARDHNCSCHS